MSSTDTRVREVARIFREQGGRLLLLAGVSRSS